MAFDIRPTAPPKIALGLCLVLAGLGLTLESLHVITPGKVLQYWPLGLVIVGISLLFEGRSRVDGSTPRSDRSGIMPIIGVLVAFFFLSQAFEHRTEAAGAASSNGSIEMNAVLGGSHAVSEAAKFTGATMRSFMGGGELDLRHATIAPGDEAVVELNVFMGGAVIRVPQGWVVNVDTLVLLGGVDDQRRDREDDDAPDQATADNSIKHPRLVLRGHVMMGGVVIKH